MKITTRRLVVATGLIAFGVLSGLGSPSTGAAGTLYQGNVTTCAGLGLGGYLDSGFLAATDGDYSNAYLSWTISGGNTTIDITDEVYNLIIHTIVVKAGNAYYTYSSPEPGMTGPPTNNGTTPRISHWFICYELGATTTSSSTTTTSTTTTTTVPSSSSTTTTTTSTTTTTTTTSTTTTTTTPGATTLPATSTTDAGVQPPINPTIPDTGGYSGGILGLAAILTGIGAFLHALIRRPA